MRLRLLVLGVLGGVAILVLAVAHARWLEMGPQDPRFVRFLRRHARRANAEAVLPPLAYGPQGGALAMRASRRAPRR